MGSINRMKIVKKVSGITTGLIPSTEVVKKEKKKKN